MPISSSYMQNRELSWLRFNDRILDEASDPAVPLLERLKYIDIYTSNLDEFFMIRVGSLLDFSHLNPNSIDNKSGMTPKEQLDAIYDAVRPMYAKREACFFEIMKHLNEHSISFLTYRNLIYEEAKYVKQYFMQSITPILSPQIVDSHHPFPHLQNKVLHIVARMKYKGKETFGCVAIPTALPNVLFLPGSETRFISIADIVQEYLELLFPGYSCLERVQICLTRNADIASEEEAADLYGDFREVMQRILSKRSRLAPVRLELSAKVSPELEAYLCSKLGLKHHQFFISRAPLAASFANEVIGAMSEAGKSLLSYPPFIPQNCISIPFEEKMIKLIQTQDILLSFPYENMAPFLQLLKEAATDPSVISIKITIYRLASKAKLVDYLCAAAENGKEVTVLIELRARFDEQNNIDWSEHLEEAGCTIIYGFRDYKVHSKICLITRLDHGTLRYITQIGTGNYNEKTAAIYTDLSLITADQTIGKDASSFFQNMMIGNLNGNYKQLLVAPVSLKKTLLTLIWKETQKGPDGRILLKLNSITDQELINHLRDASRAGVKVTMIIRGICCILPGISGETDNLQIRSIVGRFLEHSRVYCFGSGDNETMYISSADLMTRNTQRRIEIACPIHDEHVRQKIHRILNLCLSDNTHARQLQPDGTYSIIPNNTEPIDCQAQLMSEAIAAAKHTDIKSSFWKRIFKK